MTQDNETFEDIAKSRGLIPRSKFARVSIILLVILFAAASVAWLQRDVIVDDFIQGQLSDMGIEASYEIASIGPRSQTIRNVIVGDKSHPDLTIEQVEIRLAYGFGTPEIGSLKLIHPRISARYDEERGLTFGVLDKVIFAQSDDPFELPNLVLQITEGRLTFTSASGDARARFDGRGRLTGGFKGRLSANASQLTFGDCGIAATRLDAIVSVESRKPKIEGPLRLGAIKCEDSVSRIDPITLKLAIVGDRDLAGFSGMIGLDAGRIAQGDMELAGAGGDIRVEQRSGILTAKFDLAGGRLSSPQFLASAVKLTGDFRAQADANHAEARGRLAANDLRPGNAILGSLKASGNAARDTLAEPLLAKFRAALSQEARGSSFDAEFLVRQSEHSTAIIVPRAVWQSRSDGNLLSLSQLQFASKAGQISKISGNFVSGGVNMPRLNGRMEQMAGGRSILRLRMEQYSAEDASISAPELVIAQSDRGDFGLSGRVIVTGPIPGGRVQRLALPLSGGWSERGGGWLWRNCTKAAFGRFELSGLVLEGQEIEICPTANRPVLAFGQGANRFNLSIPEQDWQGKFYGETARLGLLAGTFSSDQGVSAQDIRFVSGEGEGATRLALSHLEGTLSEIAKGNFEADEFALGAVPFDFTQVNGNWSYADGVLSLGEVRLLMNDRAKPKRFNALLMRNAELTLVDGAIRAQGMVRNAASDREISDVSIFHELATGNGHADLAVPGLVFDKQLQPEQLSDLALGVIALADGTITGEGRIDWQNGEITSNGEVRTQKFDFAAAFGPVEGVSGTVRFSDLVSLTTEPNQRLQIASMNPGIEVLDGELLFELRDGQIASVKNGVWPFLGGKLTLRPVELNFGVAEERRYIIEIEGADAAQFIATMELTNLSASGLFDGTLPIVLDEFGNGRIEGGLLVSRPPGGNLSYVGELTYEDLSAMGNFAFAALRSLDYNQMMVEMNGPLIGEIVTSLRFDGVRQGESATKNFITRRIAKLPIEFRVNVRAPFYQLLTSFESMYDPSFLRDPRDLGLLETDGKRFVRPSTGETVTSDELPIQRQESELVP